MQYFEVNESQPCPLHLERCIEKAANETVRIVEPLPHLLAAIGSVITINESQKSDKMV